MFDPGIPHKPHSRPASDFDESPFQHRKAYPPEAMWELGCSIRDVGVKEDCLARPHPSEPDRLELAYGHRRRRASILAVLIAEGLTREEYDRIRTEEPDAWQAKLDEAAPRALVPVVVREMSDEEVVEEQGRENLQRAQPNAMEVALYIDTLMKPRPEGLGYAFDQVLAKTRKERGWVLKHLKLLGLSPKVREALMTRAELTEDYGFEIARLASHRLQDALLDEILPESDARQWDPTAVEVLSLHDVRQLIRHRYMLRLADAPFQTGNASLVEGRPACGTCPERTGNQQGLFADVNDDAVCTNIDCFEAKSRAQFALDAAAADAKVLPDAQARKLYEHGRLSYSAGFIEIDSPAPYQLSKHQQSLRTVLGANLPPLSWVWVPGRGKVELAKTEDVQKLLEPMLKAQQARERAARAANPDVQKVKAKEAERRAQVEVQNATNLRAMGAVVAAWPNKPSVALLTDLARTALRGCWADTLADVVRVLGLESKVEKSPVGAYKSGHAEVLGKHIDTLKKPRELVAFIACLMYCRGLTANFDGSGTKRLKDVCRQVRVNYAGIERKVRADAEAKRARKGTGNGTAAPAKAKAKANKDSKKAKDGARTSTKPPKSAHVKAKAKTKQRRSGSRTGSALPAAA